MVTITLVLLVGLAANAVAQPEPARLESKEVREARRDLEFLASDRLGGRFTGSREADSAAAYLARRFQQVGARPGVPGWLAEFPIAPDLPGLRGVTPASRPRRGVNVIALIPGRDAALKNQAVVVGAHYDHLGRGDAASSSLSADPMGQIHNGADDNGSGTVALIAIARRLCHARPKRSVVLVAFAGEEIGLLGSSAYVRSPVVPMDRTVAMVNLDMVGRLRNDRLLVFGSETAAEFPALLDSLNRSAKFALSHSGDGYGPSDQQSFYLAGRPVLHFFTDLHEDYHRPTDDWEKVDVAGLVRVAGFVADLVLSLADRPAPLTPVVTGPRSAPVAAAPGYGAYLGSVPDMTVGGPGVRLSGVRAGSPAERAGLAAGDVLLRIGRSEVADLQAMTDALRAHQPGDTAVVIFRRGSKVDSTTVVFGRRGGSR